ncbi:MAG: sulfoxide reductase heme-binding subunit YedZ [Gammaproteobacteria bacterium]|nr:sulfoxide reductase heme-binding subunit YedZ [Gammaproteobacteria bacterium]
MTKVVKPILFLLCLVPFGFLLFDAFTESLGAKPVEAITHRTGDWTLRFLLISLSVTPLRQMFGWRSLNHYRRTLGLYAFFYACLHFLTYFVLDLSFMLEDVVEDVLKRPYIAIGFLAFLMLVPLAVTSTNAMMRTLGNNWVRLHKMIYVIAMLGVFHYLWLVKDDILEPVLYAAILIVLLVTRVYYSRVQQDR